MSVLTLIPARLAATRLPNKPLALIAGEPMIVQVWRRAMEAALGPVIVACDSPQIAQAVQRAGGEALLTDPAHPSGSDRIYEALLAYESQGHAPPQTVLNLQGDLPTLEPRLLRELLAVMDNPAVDIATLAAPIVRDEEHENPSVVKAVIGGLAADATPPATGRALYFTRATAPAGDGARYHHIGVYAYRRAALQRFVTLPPSALERREKLEQLRALEAGMRIDVAVVGTVPLGVDTPQDLARARQLLGEAG